MSPIPPLTLRVLVNVANAECCQFQCCQCLSAARPKATRTPRACQQQALCCDPGRVHRCPRIARGGGVCYASTRQNQRSVPSPPAMNFQDASSLLATHGQSHVLAFWDRLDEPARAALLDQIAALDFDAIARMQDLLRNPPAPEDPGAIHPAPVQGAPSPAHRKQKAVDLVSTPDAGKESESESARAFAVHVGETMLRAGKVAVVLVAGGQGSRLGFDGHKGC